MPGCGTPRPMSASPCSGQALFRVDGSDVHSQISMVRCRWCIDFGTPIPAMLRIAVSSLGLWYGAMRWSVLRKRMALPALWDLGEHKLEEWEERRRKTARREEEQKQRKQDKEAAEKQKRKDDEERRRQDEERMKRIVAGEILEVGTLSSYAAAMPSPSMLCDVQYRPRVCNAMSGTDLGYAMRCPVLT
eukprot:292586-Rhodomonas_salina.1